MNPLEQLQACGQAVWLDYLKRSLIARGGLQAELARPASQGRSEAASATGWQTCRQAADPDASRGADG
jgi:hypothetical protein